jgi:hypothetical protein
MLKLLALGAIAVAFAEPTTLTLKCKGTTTTYGGFSEPTSLSLLVDFTKKTINGFPWIMFDPSNEVEITEVTELVITSTDPSICWTLAAAWTVSPVRLRGT